MAFILLHPGCLWARLTPGWAQGTSASAGDLSHNQARFSVQRPLTTPPVPALMWLL